jgi:hypothetical protein
MIMVVAKKQAMTVEREVMVEATRTAVMRDVGFTSWDEEEV